VYRILRKLVISRLEICPLCPKSVAALPCEILRSACYRNMIRKCFNEEVKASNKNWKVNSSAVCFLYNIFFLCYFYNRKFILFQSTVFFGKNGWLWKQPVAGWLWKKRLLNGVENGRTDVTCVVWNDHCLPEHKLRVLFATGQWSTTLC